MTRGLVSIIAFVLALITLLPSSAVAVGPGRACGGFAGIRCNAGLYCEFPAGQCGRFDMMGVCRRKPTLCPRIYMPVCGCNFQTYGNDCERRAAGVSLAHPGRCWF
ncbi:Kazal-type serine protease inhibitor family protein [Bradyrhizobium sp. HKCCYLS3013]|uniref:Kazal-type serine protease inhibitor family protein n=1 Tax=Bradyrhizobium sp. HKCCYLS3013 TaxID=3420735 RepID=UPI003EC0C963